MISAKLSQVLSAIGVKDTIGNKPEGVTPDQQVIVREVEQKIKDADHKENINSTFIEPKEISVVCPMMKTDQDINIGRLKEFIETLPVKDSHIYEILRGFDIQKLSCLAREVVERHDVRHIRTLYTQDGKKYEIWYYGKDKVNSDNIVIRISILDTNHTVEMFAATQTIELLTGLLAEVRHDMRKSIESKIVSRGGVFNISLSCKGMGPLLVLENLERHGKEEEKLRKEREETEYKESTNKYRLPSEAKWSMPAG